MHQDLCGFDVQLPYEKCGNGEGVQVKCMNRFCELQIFKYSEEKRRCDIVNAIYNIAYRGRDFGGR